MRFLGMGILGWVWALLQLSYLILLVKIHLGQREIVQRLDGRLIDKRL